MSASPVGMINEYPDFPTHYQLPYFTLLVIALKTGIFRVACYFLLMLIAAGSSSGGDVFDRRSTVGRNVADGG